jgi:hypothetical protein
MLSSKIWVTLVFFLGATLGMSLLGMYLGFDGNNSTSLGNVLPDGTTDPAIMNLAISGWNRKSFEEKLPSVPFGDGSNFPVDVVLTAVA